VLQKVQMKIIIRSLIVIFYFSSSNVFSQVGIGTVTPNASSILEIKSNNSGLLIPRINLTSTTDVTTIASPAVSLLIYNTSSSGGLTPGFYFWDGSIWKSISVTTPTFTGTSFWDLAGNTVTAANYIGTNNFFSLNFKVNNTDFGKFYPNGGINLGFGSAANANNSIAIGTSAQALTSNESIAIGFSSNTNGYQATALGYGSTASNNTTLALGHTANASGYRSASIGFTSRSTNNNAIAFGNDSNASGEQSLAIGHEANVSSQNGTAIGYQATTSQSNAIVLGSSSNGNNKVGIGTNAPDERLHVVGSVKIVDGAQANGYVLTSDANGKATWKNPVEVKTYGEIYKTTSTATLATGAISFGTNGLASNTTLATDNIQVTKTGNYRITYTVSLRKTTGGSANPELFLTIYGTEIPGTRTYATMNNNETRTMTLTKLCSLTAYQAVSLHSNLTNAGINVLSGTTLLVELVN